MMRLAEFIDAARIRAVMIVALGMAFPILLFASGGAIALTTLRRSVLDGAVVAVAGAGLVALVSALGPQGMEGFSLLLAPCVIALGLANLLRRHSLSATLLMSLVGIYLVVLAVNFSLGDAEAYWKAWGRIQLDEWIATGVVDLTAEEVKLIFEAPFWGPMTALLATFVMMNAWLGLFLGRAWQARLVNPGGFGREFRQVSFGRYAALATMGVFCSVALINSSALGDAALLLLFAWLIQGISFVHWAAAGTRQSTGILTAFYVALIALMASRSPIWVVVPLLGIVSELFGTRSRWKSDDSGT